MKLSDEDIADFEVLRHVAMATICGFLRLRFSMFADTARVTNVRIIIILYMGCTLATPGEYD